MIWQLMLWMLFIIFHSKKCFSVIFDMDKIRNIKILYFIILYCILVLWKWPYCTFQSTLKMMQTSSGLDVIFVIALRKLISSLFLVYEIGIGILHILWHLVFCIYISYAKIKSSNPFKHDDKTKRAKLNNAHSNIFLW